ncbi:MAG: VanZ family protein [Planctomycetes bacterium]|nr:VanZ family protein [Planctomycetota bacterium]
MPKASPSTAATPEPLRRAVLALFRVALGATLVLVPTLFADLHRFGVFELLFLVSLLHAFWVVVGVLGASLRHLRSGANLLVWGLLALVMFQALPLPLPETVAETDPPVAAKAGLLVEPESRPGHQALAGRGLGRYTLRPTATIGVLILLAGVVGLHWVASSALPGRKGCRWVTWSVVLALGLLAYWVVMSRVASARSLFHWTPSGPPAGLCRIVGPALVLGGDSLVPALLAALPACLLVVLRPLGWMPRRPPAERESRWGWLDRAATVRLGGGLALVALVALALGMSNVPRHVMVVTVALAAGLLLGGYAVVGPGQRGLRRSVGLALGLALWVALALWMGTLIGGPEVPAVHADGPLEAALESLPAHRTVFGLGAGTVSPRAIFGRAGWPVAPGDDVDTDGFLVLRMEVGWAGLVLAVAGAVAFGARIIAAFGGGRGPWPKTAILAGFGALSANFVYFRFDAAMLLAPNLLALAGVLAFVTAWAAHGAHGRPERARELGESRWPLVAAAVGLLGAIGLAENQMLSGAGVTGHSDKILHFGTFGVLSLLLCYALGPTPTTHYLKSRILLAVVGTTALGALMEVGQVTLTAGRSFEYFDMLANGCGAVLMGTLWWVVRRGQAVPPPDEPA